MSYTGKNIDLSKYEKYGKAVELSKIEVELNAIQDMESVSKKALTISKDKTIISKAEKLEVIFENSLKELDSLEKDYNNQRKAADNIYKELDSLFNKLYKQVKELGLKIEDLPVYKNYLSARESISEYRNDAQEAWNKVYRFKK